MADLSLADWDLVQRVATLVAQRNAPVVHADEAAKLRADLHATVQRADDLAREATGLGGGLPPANAYVVGRGAWIRANTRSLAWLTDPLAERVLRRSGMARALTRQVLALQLGAVLGFLASRVLGQYEAILPDDRVPGRLLLVGPNLLHVERTVVSEEGLDPAEFRLGIVLHELAHRLQFEAVDWLRPLLRELLDDYFADARVDTERLQQIAARLPELLRDPSRLADPQRLIELVLTPGQREVLERAQAMMSLLEGHGNVVMDWGAEVAGDRGEPDFDPTRVRTVLNRRRSKVSEQALRTALGLSMKARQYAVGERFILDVEQRHGRDAFNRVWEDPSHLPTPDELSDADAWIRRIGPRG